MFFRHILFTLISGSCGSRASSFGIESIPWRSIRAHSEMESIGSTPHVRAGSSLQNMECGLGVLKQVLQKKHPECATYIVHISSGSHHSFSTPTLLCFRHFICDSLKTCSHHFKVHLRPDHHVQGLGQDACTSHIRRHGSDGTEFLQSVFQVPL